MILRLLSSSSVIWSLQNYKKHMCGWFLPLLLFALSYFWRCMLSSNCYCKMSFYYLFIGMRPYIFMAMHILRVFSDNIWLHIQSHSASYVWWPFPIFRWESQGSEQSKPRRHWWVKWELEVTSMFIGGLPSQ